MIYTIFLAVLAIIAVIIAVKAVIYLFRNSWFSGFCRGLWGIILLGCAVVLGLFIWDLYSYKQLPKESSVGTIRFEQLDEQHYRAHLTIDGHAARSFDMMGDQWQLDARFIKIKQPFSRWGVEPLYRLERLNGRYYSLEDELNKKRSLYELESSTAPIDTWKWLHTHVKNLAIFDTAYGTAVYLPMVDKAQFQLNISANGLIPRPLNAEAKKAVEQFINLE